MLGAAEWNVNCLQQARWTQEVLAGTNADKIGGAAMTDPFDLTGHTLLAGKNGAAHPTPSAAVGALGVNWNHSAAGGEVNLYNTYNTPSGTAFDFWAYNGTTWLQLLILSLAGKLTGKGFYDSGEVTLANGGIVTLTHGLGARPRYYAGVYNTVAGTTGDASTTAMTPVSIHPIAATALRVNWINNASINLVNDGASTAYFRVFAML